VHTQRGFVGTVSLELTRTTARPSGITSLVHGSAKWVDLEIAWQAKALSSPVTVIISVFINPAAMLERRLTPACVVSIDMRPPPTYHTEECKRPKTVSMETVSSGPQSSAR